MRWLVAACLFAGLLAAGQACVFFDDDPPDDSCSNDNDCFRAQGERCVDNHCKVVNMGGDAGVDSP